jgi:hypothetical protein
MKACGPHPARRTRLLVVVLGIASALAACGNNQASPAARSATTVTTPASGATPPAEVTRLFAYDRRQPLGITKLGTNTGRLPAQALDRITVESITYTSPKGGEVPALVVVPNGRGPFPGVIVQHGRVRGDLSLTPHRPGRADPAHHRPAPGRRSAGRPT